MPKKNVIKKSALVPTALVAGGAGFIGSHLCEALLAKGARVIALDNLKTGKTAYVSQLLTNPKFALYNTDVNEGLPVEIESVDYVFHLAGLEEYLYSKNFLDLDSLLTNAVGTKNLLDLAQKSGAKFLLLSTTDVYEGRMSQLEIDNYFGRSESEENKYALTEAKRYAEALVWEYHKKNETDARIVRVPEVYGPRMSLEASGGVGYLLKDLVEGGDLVIRGDGLEKSFYLYIDDAVSGIMRAMFSEQTVGNIFSLVHSDPISILEVGYLIKSLADREVRVKFEDTASGKPRPVKAKTPDTFNLHLLKWEPRVSLKEGIVKSLAALGYMANAHSFKPAKFIDEKVEAQEKNEAKTEDLFSLQDVKDAKPQVEQPKEIGAGVPSLINLINGEVKPRRKFSLRFPKFSRRPKEQVVGTPKAEKPKFPSWPVLLTVGVIGVILALFVVIPLVETCFNVRSGVNSLRGAAELAGQLNSDEVKQKTTDAFTNFYNAKKAFVKLRPVFSLFGKASQFRSMDNLLGSLTYFSKAGYSAAKAVKPVENLWEVILPNTPQEINPQDFADAKGFLSQAKTSLELAQTDFKYADTGSLPAFARAGAAQYGGMLTLVSQNLDMAISAYGSLPNLLGADKPKKYLILFQNSNEIRPTGGFVGSYGLLTLNKGKIADLTIDDIYNPDGQIDQRSIKSDVPLQLKTLLSETTLHLRNANWNPDFPTSANTIRDLYRKVTGEELDGVLAVDLYFVQNLLKATGPIFLTAYNEEVNYQNVYERAELHSEFNYENGSDQKRSFLTVLGSKLLEKIFVLNREQLPALLGSLDSSLNDRHLLVYFANDPLNETIRTKKWDGSLVETPGDYLYVVNANLGGTKANYYVKNNMVYDVSSLTRDGVLRATLRLEYTHAGKDLAWPSGPYTDYVRVYTGAGTKLTAATIKVGEAAEENIFKKLDTSTQGKYSVFGTSFVLQPASKAVITISYDLPVGETVTKTSPDYELYWQKQPGTQDDTFTFRFQPPFGFNVQSLSPLFTTKEGVLEAAGALNSDRNFYVKLQ